MTRRQTDMDPPVHLEMPLTPPAPVAHCAVCEGAATARDTATARGDLSAATDASVVIRAHPHEDARPAL